MQKVLVLGGTRFIGRNLMEHLIEQREFELTLFNRGRTGPDLFPDIKCIEGDRETSDIKRIGQVEWDIIIDLSCYYPNTLATLLKTLKAPPNKYVLISTCSVYDSSTNKSILRTEEAETLQCSMADAEDMGVSTYGNRKAECERILREAGIPYTILRPALVYGRYDHSDRFYYWLYQVATRDRLIIPDGGERRFSTTLVHDLVQSIALAMRNPETRGTFNVITSPETRIIDIVSASGRSLNRNPEVITVKPEHLIARGISEWTDIPLWLNTDQFTFSNEKLIEDSDFSPSGLETGLKDATADAQTRNWPRPSYGKTQEELEQALLL